MRYWEWSGFCVNLAPIFGTTSRFLMALTHRVFNVVLLNEATCSPAFPALAYKKKSIFLLIRRETTLFGADVQNLNLTEIYIKYVMI